MTTASPDTKGLLRRFFERSLFERIIIYLFASELCVKIIFELILGKWEFVQSQNKQWFFYSFLLLDYVISVKKVTQIRVTVNPMSLMALTFLIMVTHGLFMGLIQHNAPFVIFNDMVPLTMIALNILRMQSVNEAKAIDLRFLLTACAIIMAGTGFFGFLAAMLHKPSGPSIPADQIYFPLFFAALFALRPFPVWIALLTGIMFFLTIDDINRTSMAFFALILPGYLAFIATRNPGRAFILSIGALAFLAAAFYALPKESKTYARIVNLGEVDLSESTGAIGERQEEWRAINKKYDEKGPVIEFFGLGFGGVYEVARTHTYLTNYGHAHYSWAWFKLRFGQMGYLYLALFAAAILYNGIMWSLTCRPEGVFMGFLCLLSLLYCMTYVNAVFLSSGLQFLYHRIPRKNDTEESPV